MLHHIYKQSYYIRSTVSDIPHALKTINEIARYRQKRFSLNRLGAGGRKLNLSFLRLL